MKSIHLRAAVLGAAALLFSSLVSGADLKEVQGPFYVASPQFFGSANSGTYYYPSIIQQGSYAFLFTQGGQFSASTTPAGVGWCEGDKIMMWPRRSIPRRFDGSRLHSLGATGDQQSVRHPDQLVGVVVQRHVQ